MRAFFTCAILTVTTLTINAVPATAQTVNARDIIDGWYHQYLGRHVDHAGMHDHLHAIRHHGASLESVEAAILASPEYYARNGNTPEGFAAALYRDVLGRRASHYEFDRQVDCVLVHGRTAAARRVMALRNPPVVVTSAPPVVVTPAPVIVPRPAPVVVIGGGYRPAPVYVAPRPSVSLRFNFR